MTTAESTGTVVMIDGAAGQSRPLRDGLSDRWRVADSVAEAGPVQYGLIGTSDGANAALLHALENPESVEALVLISPNAVRPADGDAGGDGADLEGRLGEVQCPTLVIFGSEDRSVPPGTAAIYRERVPNCNVAYVYAAGRDIAAERPQALVTWYPTTWSGARPSSSRTAAASSTRNRQRNCQKSAGFLVVKPSY